MYNSILTLMMDKIKCLYVPINVWCFKFLFNLVSFCHETSCMLPLLFLKPWWEYSKEHEPSEIDCKWACKEKYIQYHLTLWCLTFSSCLNVVVWSNSLQIRNRSYSKLSVQKDNFICSSEVQFLFTDIK